MKLDRLLSEIIFLLNREMVSASSLAERFGVSRRTIQRDMECIELAGIPIFTLQGPQGGYGIVESYKMERQLMSVDDFYYIVTALKGVAGSLDDEHLDSTLQKVQTLLPRTSTDIFFGRNEKLSLDFSMLGGDQRHREAFKIVREAVEHERLLRFRYTNNKLESTTRIVEPLTIAFRWRSWYLYAYCRNREDYRLFRISRIQDPEILASIIHRRELSFEQFLEDNYRKVSTEALEIELKFAPIMRAMVEEYYEPRLCRILDDGSLLVRTRMPEDGWLYGYILSFGEYVEVLKPHRLRKIIAETAGKIEKIY
ncbi:transcriptional regulator [Marispirochaeta aestuarii]|uniref:Transcriptional regulator n=1 Tax=Marispirochaeta aestuarii TaxID=1963862 RepID=A0A1Y1RWX3_9SPIO|nr:YafY family protein [Marispirochaeta aestuarii]ORC34035.1 transcriptional regulator [Marispirochaeta aestuarii]